MADREARAKLARAAVRLNARSAYAGRVPPLIMMTDDMRLADPRAAAEALPRGSLVIVRARAAVRRAQLARDLSAVARAQDLFLLIAADPELAMRCGADGLHLPEARACEAAHWRARRPCWLITCAAHDRRAIRRARAARADAVLVSPVFATQSHADARPLGAMGLRILARDAGLPIYALGGLDGANARRLGSINLAGLAAIGALAL